MDLELGSLLWLSGWVWYNHKDSYKGGRQDDKNQGEVIRKEAEAREERRCCVSGFEGGRKSHKSRNAGGLNKLEKVREQIFPRSLINLAVLPISWF